MIASGSSATVNSGTDEEVARSGGRPTGASSRPPTPPGSVSGSGRRPPTADWWAKTTAGASITASYSVGAVPTTGGGLVGNNAGTVTDSYYDRQTSGRSDTGKGVPKTTTELKTPTGYTGIYANWNLDLSDPARRHMRTTRGGSPSANTPSCPWASPSSPDVRMLSSPASGDTYGAGERIVVLATFSEPIVRPERPGGGAGIAHAEAAFQLTAGSRATRSSSCGSSPTTDASACADLRR